MKLNIFKTLAWGILAMGFVACEKDIDKADYDAPLAGPTILPEVTTGDVELFGVLANITCEMTPVEGANPTNWGVLVSESKTLSLAGSQMYEGNVAANSATFAVSGLEENTTYYYRSFVTDGVNVTFGETKEFETGKAWLVQTKNYDFATAEKANEYMPYRRILAAADEKAVGPTTVQFLPMYGFTEYVVVSSILDPVAFYESFVAALASPAVMNAAGFKYDFTGSLFPTVIVDVISNSTFFQDGGDVIGHFDVYVSKEPIEDLDGLAKATKFGSSQDSSPEQKLYVANSSSGNPNVHTPLKFTVPKDFWGECYVYIVNKSDLEGAYFGTPDYGIAIRGYAIETTSPPAEETPEEVTPEVTPEEV